MRKGAHHHSTVPEWKWFCEVVDENAIRILSHGPKKSDRRSNADPRYWETLHSILPIPGSAQCATVYFTDRDERYIYGDAKVSRITAVNSNWVNMPLTCCFQLLPCCLNSPSYRTQRTEELQGKHIDTRKSEISYIHDRERPPLALRLLYLPEERCKPSLTVYMKKLLHHAFANIN
jgi:hypothetical protein